MSWQEYVDVQLLGSGKIQHAAILGQQGGVWAQSPGIKISPEEQKEIIAGHGRLDHVQEHGVRVGGQKYFTLQADKRSIYGKKAADGVVIVKTKLAIIVGIYIGPVQTAEATPVVEKLGDYLISVNY